MNYLFQYVCSVREGTKLHINCLMVIDRLCVLQTDDYNDTRTFREGKVYEEDDVDNDDYGNAFNRFIYT